MIKYRSLSLIALWLGCYFLLLNVSLRLTEGNNKMFGKQKKEREIENVSYLKKNNEKLISIQKDSISKIELMPEISNQTFQKILDLYHSGNSDAPKEVKQVIIVSTWRSGSTFLNQLLDSHPATFNHFEPLQMYNNFRRIYKDDPSYNEARDLILDLLSCRYRNLEYFNSLKKTPVHLIRNARIKEICSFNKESLVLGFRRNFLKSFCSLFPIKLMKLVSAGMDLLVPALEVPSFNSHIILLVRDPRAIISSRHSVTELGTSSLLDPAIICKFMMRDLDSAITLKQKYPGRIHILRFEDLAWSPSQTIRKLFNKMGMVFVPEVVNFLEQHTKMEISMNDPWSVARDSSRRIVHWITKIDENILRNTERSCDEVMDRLGYLPIQSKISFLQQNLTNNFNEYSLFKTLPSLSWYSRLYKKIDHKDYIL